MPTFTPYQRTFAAGEIAPWLYSRGNTVQYLNGCALCRNAQPASSGAAFNRAGTEHVAEVAASAQVHRVIGWIFDDDDRYALQLGHETLRFHQQGATVLAGSPAAYSATAHYVPGDLVSSAGTNYYCIQKNSGVAPGPGGYWYAMPASGVLELPTPWDADDLELVKFAQLYDIMWLTHPDYDTYRLTRLDHTRWTLQPESFAPAVRSPDGLGSTSGGSGTTRRYKVTAVQTRKGKEIEGLSGNDAVTKVGALSGGAGVDIVVTSTAHGITAGNDVLVVDAYPTTGTPNLTFEAQLEGRIFNCGTVAANTFDLDGTTGLTVPSGYAVAVIPIAGSAGTALTGTLNNPGSTVDADVQVGFVTHGLAEGDEVTVFAVAPTAGTDPLPEMEALLVRKNFRVTVINATTFVLRDTSGAPSDSLGLYSIVFAKAFVEDSGGTASTAGGNVTLSWTAVPGADTYFIYKQFGGDGGSYGYLHKADGTTYTDRNQDGETEPELEDGPPTHIHPFRGADNQPAAVGFYDQRLVFAGTHNDPSKFWLSQAGDFLNFGLHSPIIDADSVVAEIALTRVSDIRHIVDMDRIVFLSSGRKAVAEGDADGSITPTTQGLRARGGAGGASHVRPEVVDEDILFIDARQQILRRMRLDLVQGQQAADLTTFAAHLFKGYTIVDMCWTAVPEPTLWLVRSDGQLISCTYVPAQDVLAYARHDTGSGTDFGFESICAIPEDGIDRLYAVVRRTVSGSSKRYVERFAPRKAGDADYVLLDDAWHVDSGARVDGRNTSATTLTLSGGPPWTAGATLTLTASAATFPGDASNVGKRYKLYSGANIVHVTVTVDGSTTVQTVTCVEAVPVALQGVATLVWSAMFSSVTGLSHLEGRMLSGLADNVPFSNRSVALGVMNLPTYAEVAVVGLPVATQIQTLPPTSARLTGELEIAQKKAVRVVVDVTDTVSNSTYGLRVGASEVPGVAPVGLFPLEVTPQDTSTAALLDGKLSATVGGNPAREAGIWIAMADHLPMQVNGVVGVFEIEEAVAG